MRPGSGMNGLELGDLLGALEDIGVYIPSFEQSSYPSYILDLGN